MYMSNRPQTRMDIGILDARTVRENTKKAHRVAGNPQHLGPSDPPTKVLFLDIDGVLNSARSCYAMEGFPHGFDDKNKARFDWIAVGLIRRLCEETGASIVLSSSWRILHSVHECANGLDLPIFDKTPGGGGHRGKQIKEWLDAHPEVVTYAIVDDDSDMLPRQRKYFVKTNHMDGLSMKNYGDLKRILGIDSPPSG